MMYSPFRHYDSILRKKRVIHLTFFITRKCNLKCPFCFYLTDKDNPSTSAAELNLSEIEQISHSMGSLLWLAFSGGEIFLREDLAEISKVFYRNNKPAIMLFPTNGMLPDVIRDVTEEILNYCKKSVITVKLSIDGPAGMHDRLRNREGSYVRTMETYRKLEELVDRHPNFELGVNTVFCSENQDAMDEVIDSVRGMGNIKTHTISLVRGNISQEGYKKVDYKKYDNAVKRLESGLKNRTSSKYRFKGARIKAAQDILQRRLIHQTSIEKRRLIPCYAGRLNLVLRENGDVYPCEILTEALGNVRDWHYDLEEMVRSEKASKVIHSIVNNKCYCTHECFFMTNILFNPRLYPKLAKEYIQI
jgi:radical SAM protein with 4Fe4S-binding SPASM domain